MPEALTIQSTNLVELEGLLHRATNAYPSTAVVTFDLLDSANAAVTGATGISMSFVTGTSGRFSLYRGVIPNTVALVEGETYTAKVTATYSGAVRVFYVHPVAEQG